ncbi:MAG TPA: phosphotransferase [Dissulfurispiraceae bacterium]|nr:phosphotransferase [Dissulfurispiraceae bacterium]
MQKEYLGRLDYRDPLYEILLERVFTDVAYPCFHVNKFARGGVYQYVEEHSQRAIVGKFFRLNDRKPERALRIKGEFEKLQRIRSYGFSALPHYVVKPLAQENSIGLAVVEEYVHGKDLDYYLVQAMYCNGGEALMIRLAQLAAFLHELHDRTCSHLPVAVESVCGYFGKIVEKLHTQTLLMNEHRSEAYRLMDRWLHCLALEQEQSVLVHGDATPTNFFFSGERDVIAIDLERMRDTDRMVDIGMVCGELKHAFLWRTGCGFPAEPFIRHFLKKYCSHFPDRKEAFRIITRRNPFFMAMTEFRIARNRYLDWNYRKRLVFEAMECLRWGLRM